MNTNIDFIFIKILGHLNPPFMWLNLRSNSIFDTTMTKIDLSSYNKHSLIIETSIVHTPNNKNCINNYYGQFTDNRLDKSFMNCINQNLNETFGCIPILDNIINSNDNSFLLQIDVDYYNYNICHDNFTNDEILMKNKLINRCMDNITSFCETQIFNVINNYEYNKKNVNGRNDPVRIVYNPEIQFDSRISI